jgi:RNA polymerase sigma factor (sigma-70 family)
MGCGDEWGDALKQDLANILEAHGPLLHALLLRLTLRQDAADDLLQELFVKLVNAPGLRAAADPLAYVKRTAINLAFDWRRGRRRATPTPETDVGAVAPDAPALDVLIDREDVERILDASANLGELSGQAFVLRYVQQESFEAIAAALGRTPHQARGLCHAAVAELRSRLREKVVPHERER